MNEELRPLLEIQELDIKMIRLMRIKKQRQSELKQIESLRLDLNQQLTLKQEEVDEFDKQINTLEQKLQELTEKYKKLEAQQSGVKKVEEFNALTQEMSMVEKEKVVLETQTSNILDRKGTEEEILEKIKESLKTSEANSAELEKEILSSIEKINIEGQQLKDKRESAVSKVNPHTFKIYQRLLRNKKDRVIVPIENHTCSGCHIALTLYHEGRVRKGDAIVFCEHCSRIHFWQEDEARGGRGSTTRRRRRHTIKT